MSTTTSFDRDATARNYATLDLQTDPGLISVQYLPGDSPEREIRLVEVNSLMPERVDSSLIPIDFGRDRGTETEHLLVFLDVTPAQWQRILTSDLELPPGWSLDNRVEFP